MTREVIGFWKNHSKVIRAVPCDMPHATHVSHGYHQQNNYYPQQYPHPHQQQQPRSLTTKPPAQQWGRWWMIALAWDSVLAVEVAGIISEVKSLDTPLLETLPLALSQVERATCLVNVPVKRNCPPSRPGWWIAVYYVY